MMAITVSIGCKDCFCTCLSLLRRCIFRGSSQACARAFTVTEETWLEWEAGNVPDVPTIISVTDRIQQVIRCQNAPLTPELIITAEELLRANELLQIYAKHLSHDLATIKPHFTLVDKFSQPPRPEKDPDRLPPRPIRRRTKPKS
ncbi:MAG: hypothetical protein LIP77_01865 [Planctomycetes bacterium]|nr:hypothetical protein [Planctomycetota bacterium]